MNSDTLLSEDRAKHLSQRLRHIVRHAYDNASAVKEIMDGAGVFPAQPDAAAVQRFEQGEPVHLRLRAVLLS